MTPNSLPSLNPSQLSTNADPLAGLRPYHLPQPISWWPPAPGWWIVFVLLLIVIVIALRRWYHRYKRFAIVRQAQKELIALRMDWIQRGDVAYLMRELSKLLRRFAVARFSRHCVAGLTGKAWLEFLDAHGGSGQFCTEPGCLLAQLPYRDDATAQLLLSKQQQVEELMRLVSHWINHNREPIEKC